MIRRCAQIAEHNAPALDRVASAQGSRRPLPGRSAEQFRQQVLDAAAELEAGS